MDNSLLMDPERRHEKRGSWIWCGQCVLMNNCGIGSAEFHWRTRDEARHVSQFLSSTPDNANGFLLSYLLSVMMQIHQNIKGVN
ncbi:MAG TPA: hypothetical protein DCP92_07835 [Nitrospiraceae bacterium]|nr:hypothetical protein [Nitrospiraceae bacterium]